MPYYAIHELRLGTLNTLKTHIDLFQTTMRHRKIALNIYHGCVGADASISSETVQSRKRKLWELYAVTTALEPIPHFRDAAIKGANNIDFDAFVAQNDIER